MKYFSSPKCLMNPGRDIGHFTLSLRMCLHRIDDEFRCPWGNSKPSIFVFFRLPWISADRNKVVDGHTGLAERILIQVLMLVCLFTSALGSGLDFAVDGHGNYLVVSEESNLVHLVMADGRVSVFADPSGNPITFDEPLTGIAFDQQSATAYVSDFDEVFRVTAQGLVSPVAGNQSSARYGFDVASDGTATETPLYDVVALVFDTLSDTLFIAEYDGRILAVQSGRVRLYAGNGPQGYGGVTPIRDMAVAQDGSLYVLGRDRVWRVPTDGSPARPVGYREGGIDTLKSGPASGMPIPGLVSLTTRDNRIYVSTVRGEIFRFGPDEEIEEFGSGEVSATGIAFTPSGHLALLSGDPREFKLIELGRDGTVFRAFPKRKPEGGPPQRRIIGGGRVSRNEFLEVVAVGLGDGRSCTGSLISEEWVLTAVHCLENAGPFTVSVCNELYGHRDFDDCLYREVPVRNVYIHPRYEHRGFLETQHLPSELLDLLPPELPRAWPYDVALLRLDRALEGLIPIELADFTKEQYNYYSRDRQPEAYQVGWGNTNYSLTSTIFPPHKRLILTPIRFPDRCRDFLNHGPKIRSLSSLLGLKSFLDSVNDLDHPLWNHAICAGWPYPPIQLASWGDSGGPLLVGRSGGGSGAWLHLGALSTSRPRLAVSGTPSADFLNVYTRTSSVYDWIDEVTGIGSSTIPQDSLDDSLRPTFGRFRDCEACPELMALPPGSFIMGTSPSELIGETPQHLYESPQQRVSVQRRLAVGVFEVTFREWYRCVDEGGCNERPTDDPLQRTNYPVTNVSYEDTIRYLMWLSEKTGRPYRLLTEAEWEYVARAGTSTPYHTGASISKDQANFESDWLSTVGSYPPNSWGLYDVAGNVDEWVQDCWRDNLVGQDPFGLSWQMSDCSRHVIRGGSWRRPRQSTRSAHRSKMRDGFARSWIGFRVARTLRDSAGALPPGDDHANTESGASRLELGAAATGWLNHGQDRDWFRLELAKSTEVTVHLIGNIRVDASIKLPGGFRRVQDERGSRASSRRVKLSAGTHYMYVQAISGEENGGYYSLSVDELTAEESDRFDHGDSAATARELRLGERIHGQFKRARDEDWFVIRITDNAKVRLYTTGSLDTVGELWVAPNRLVITDDDSGSGSNFHIKTSLEKGTYYLRVTEYSGSEGNRQAYRLHTEEDNRVEFDVNKTIVYNGIRLANIEQLSVENDDQYPSRLLLTVSVMFEDLPNKLDQLFPRVTDNRCSQKGIRESVPFIHSRGEILKVLVRMRLQWWACVGGKRKFTWYNKQKDMIIRLSTRIRWGRDPYIEIVPVLERIRYSLANIRAIRNQIASEVSSRSYRIPIPWDVTGSSCSASEVRRLVNLRFESIHFSGEGDDVRLVAKFSMDRNLNQVLRCLPLPSGT